MKSIVLRDLLHPTRFAAVTACVAAAVLSVQAMACSTFALPHGGGAIMGRNADAGAPLPGLIIINKRGIEKTALSWGVLGPAGEGTPTARWTSRYGSVTVTAIGREFPDGGMNEAGLAIEEMTLLESIYPHGDTRPSIPQTQWIQYQLDNFSSVAEVIAHLDAFNITGWAWHFTVADASGACATIEFLGGRPVVDREGSQVRGCLLTNDTRERSVAHLAGFRGFGGTQAEPQDSSSLSRFVRGAAALAGSRTSEIQDRDRVRFGFSVLQTMAAGPPTIRSIIHDLRARRLYFRSFEYPSIKYVDLNRLDFSADSRVDILPFDSPLEGDVTERLEAYSTAANRQIVREFFARIMHSSEQASALLARELQDAGVTEQEYIERIARYPEVGTRRTAVFSYPPHATHL